MPTHVVTALHLNLRSAPDPTKKNVVAVLAQGTPIDWIANSSLAGWFEVDAVVGGTTLRGHVNSAHLGPPGTPFPTAHIAAGKLPPADLGSKATETRAAKGTRAYSIGETAKPGRPSTHALGNAAGILHIIDWLDVGNSAHLRWQGAGGKTFCNVYVYDVCDTAGVYIPRVWWNSKAISDLEAGKTVAAKYGSTVLEMRANYIFNWLVDYGADFGWTRVFDADTLQSDVNSGRVGIICAQRNDMEKPGHIQIIAPEHAGRAAKRIGGKVTQPLQSNAGATNFTYGFLGSNWWQASSFKQFGFWSNDVV
jgi:hypothetical protein